ncbi:MAG: hypothetical protein ACRD26_10460 [Vicinamibacterales bacterium]
MTFQKLESLIAGAPHVFELYLAIVGELWEHAAADVRKLLGPSHHYWDRAGAMDKAERRLSSLNELTSTDVLTGGFETYRTALVGLIVAERQAGDSPDHLPLAFALRLLFRMDSLVGGVLLASEFCTYPEAPSTGFTIVARRSPYYAPDRMDRPLSQLRDRDSLRAAFWSILRTTYVIPPPAGELTIRWSVRRLPDLVEARLLMKGRKRILLVALPHDIEALNCSVDRLRRSFAVHGLTPGAEARVVDEVRSLLDEQLRRRPWSVILLPEYAGTPAVRACVREVVGRHPHRTALVVPGSTREGDGPSRNHCRCLGPDGSEGPHLPAHSKRSRFELTRSRVPEKHRAEIDACGGSVTEAIEIEDCELIFWDSSVLKRTVILICKDLLDDPTRFFLRMHYMDHIFVPAMTPTLDDFAGEGVDLALLLGAGLYIANAPLWQGDHADRPAALAYRPIRGAHQNTVRSCAATHAVCTYGFDLVTGWMD